MSLPTPPALSGAEGGNLTPKIAPLVKHVITMAVALPREFLRMCVKGFQKLPAGAEGKGSTPEGEHAGKIFVIRFYW
jgi:hypothetical protein